MDRLHMSNEKESVGRVASVRLSLDFRKLRNRLPEILAVLSLLCLIWLAVALTWPLRLPEPDPWSIGTGGVRVAKREIKSFATYKQTIKSRVLFAPPVPIIAKSTGAVVIEDLLKKIKLSGVTTVRGQPAAIISIKGKGGIYRAGSQVGSFRLKEIRRDKVVLELDGQEVNLTL